MRAKTICIADKYNTAATSPGPGAYEGPNLQPREKKIYSSKYKCPKMGTLRLTANRF